MIELNPYEFQLTGVPRNEGVWVRVENFDVLLKRTDVGIVVSVFDYDDEQREEALAECWAVDGDTAAYQEREA